LKSLPDKNESHDIFFVSSINTIDNINWVIKYINEF
jgi:hypothetical protein